ncbi:MAG: DNA-directed RNA polymerase [Candidatus Diapherotrites archaeon]|nr:DNA-directed RNA polymerase [Candidatus Diapherotrites archaeon]
MYKLITLKDTVRVPPALFGKKIDESVVDVLRQKYENKIDADLGVILAISKVKDIGDGRIIPGDGAAYHDLTFEALAFQPKLHETFTGKVSEIAQFGAFVRMGPIDGLVHVSQVTDDFISYNEKTGTLTGKESGKILKEGDSVRAKVVTLSMKPLLTDSKIGLTMRQPGLGKIDWIEDAKKPKKKPAAKGSKPKR